MYNFNKVYYDKTKEVLREAVSDLNNKDFRSAANIMYTAFLVDLFEKLSDNAILSNKNRKKYQNILNDTQFVKNTTDGIKFDPSAEVQFIKKVQNSTRFLNNTNVRTDCESLKKIRNYSSHPYYSLEEGVQIYKPNEKVLWGILENLTDNLFSKPSRMFENVINDLTDELADCQNRCFSFDTTCELVNNHYFKVMDNSQRLKIAEQLYEFTFVKNQEMAKKYRTVNFIALVFLLKTYPDIQENLIKKNNGDFINHFAKDSDVLCFMSLFCLSFPLIYKSIECSERKLINSVIFQSHFLMVLAKYQLNLDIYDNVSREINSIIQQKKGDLMGVKEKISQSTTLTTNFINCQHIFSQQFHNSYPYVANFISLFFKQLNKQNRPVFDDLIQTFSYLCLSGYSYNNTENLFPIYIKEFINEFSEDNLINLLTVANENDQIYAVMNCLISKSEMVNLLQKYNVSPDGQAFKDKFPNLIEYFKD